jgi:hypothetical protein
MNSLEQHFESVRNQIRAAEIAANRPAGAVQLLAVSKTKPAEQIAAAYRLGQRHFGETIYKKP